MDTTDDWKMDITHTDGATRVQHIYRPDRPDWVPANAVWANGLWMLNGQSLQRLGLDPTAVPMPPEVILAKQLADKAEQQAKLTEGLERGQYRHGGLVYGPDKKVVRPDNQDWRPGHAEARETRIAAIVKANAEEQKAIDALARATQRRHEAAAKRSQASDVIVEA